MICYKCQTYRALVAARAANRYGAIYFTGWQIVRAIREARRGHVHIKQVYQPSISKSHMKKIKIIMPRHFMHSKWHLKLNEVYDESSNSLGQIGNCIHLNLKVLIFPLTFFLKQSR